MGAQTPFYFFNCTNFLSVVQGVRNRAESHRHRFPTWDLSGGPWRTGRVGTEAREAGAWLSHAQGWMGRALCGRGLMTNN